MIIKKYQGKTETEAMMKAKEDLGSNAVIMNIKTTKRKGLFGFFKTPEVEVTAAIEEENVSQAVKEVSRLSESIEKVKKEEEQKDSGKPLGQDTQPIETGAIEEKLDSLQNLLEKQLHKGKEEKEEEQEQQKNENELFIKMVYNTLLEHDVDERYANQLIDEVEKGLKKDMGIDYVLSNIYQKMVLKMGEPALIDVKASQRQTVFFVGPTGVGKTTTIAKIASKYSLTEKCKVALLTADTYRIAAAEQLRTYANILNVPFKVIYTAEDLAGAIEEFKDYDLILVDTAGHSHQNEGQIEDLKKLIAGVPEEISKQVYLVLSATTKYKDLLKITDAYKDIMEYRLLFTKIDETTSIGNIFNIRQYTKAPLSYIANGQNVPDDIEQISPQRIVKKLLGGN